MSNTVTNLPNGTVVITHIPNAGNEIGQTAAPSSIYCLGRVKSMAGQFLKGHPKALGTVQIMIGVLIFLIGIIMAPDPNTLGVFSGIFVWGAIFYIIAGSLTVAAADKTSKCLVNGSLGMNIVASVGAATGIILYSMDAAGLISYYYWYCREDHYICDILAIRSQGISAVLAIFSFLEFIVSICVASFACKATCDCTSEPQRVQVVSQYVPPGSSGNPQVLTPAFNPNQTVPAPTNPEWVFHQTVASQEKQPPPYDFTSP